MRVAFWNGSSLSEGVAEYMAAIGTILKQEYYCEVVLSSNYISNHMLQDCFFGKIKETEIARASYCYLYDSPEYYRALWNMKQSRYNDILEIPMEGVTVIFPPDESEKRMFYYEAPPDAFYLLDVAGGNSTAFQSALEEAELIVVFLSQDVVKIHNFFERFSSLIPKAIFVIEEHQRAARSLFHKNVAEYGISYRNIGSIPYSKAFIEACEIGNLELFLKKNRATKSPQYNFFSGIKNIAKLLYERSNCK